MPIIFTFILKTKSKCEFYYVKKVVFFRGSDPNFSQRSDPDPGFFFWEDGSG